MKPGRLRLGLRLAGAVSGLALLGLGAGLAWFIHVASRQPDMQPQADGIVALTGGAERIETALRLLAAGRAPLLLVTGIGGGAELPELARLAGIDPAPLAARVTLDRTANSTRTNAEVAAVWVAARRLRSLIVVTAGYHMPRALTELQRAMPGVRLTPAPVLPPAMQGPAGLRDAATLRLMAEEYVKFIAASLGLSGRLSRTGWAHPGSPSGTVPPGWRFGGMSDWGRGWALEWVAAATARAAPGSGFWARRPRRVGVE